MIKLIYNKNDYYDESQSKDVIKKAIELASEGKLRNVLNQDKEIAYWFAPEVDKGKSEISTHEKNKYKTVSLRIDNKVNTPLTSPQYNKVLNELKRMSQKFVTNKFELFVIVGEPIKGNEKVMIDGNNRPYSYTDFNSAEKSLMRLINKLKKQKPLIYKKLQIIKYSPTKIGFEHQGRKIDKFLVIQDDKGFYIDSNGDSTKTLDEAVCFETDDFGFQNAIKFSQEFNGHIIYCETRELYKL